ncbi:MAG: cyclic nucleotide-binding domain-containing protein [Bacteroidota bacterium]
MDHTELKHTLLAIYPNLKEESLNSLLDFCEYKQMSKHTHIISEGKHHQYSYLLLTGGAKSFYVKDAKEVCIWFAFEQEFIGSIATYQGLPSKETVVLLEDSDLI